MLNELHSIVKYGILIQNLDCTPFNPLSAICYYFSWEILSLIGPGPLGLHLGAPRSMHQGAAKYKINRKLHYKNSWHSKGFYGV